MHASGAHRKENGIKLRANRAGSIFSFFFTDEEVADFESAKTQDTQLFKKFFHGMLKENIYLSPSGFEANFLSSAHAAKDIDETLTKINKVLKGLKGEMK